LQKHVNVNSVLSVKKIVKKKDYKGKTIHLNLLSANSDHLSE